MENYVSKLIRSYLETRNEYYYERLQEQFLPLIKAYARKLYYLDYEDTLLYNFINDTPVS